MRMDVAAQGCLPFLSFCAASSSVYIFNDLIDQDADALHRQKKTRPLPSGRVSRKGAIFLCVLMLGITGGAALSISGTFFAFVLVYLGIMVSYSLYLKDKPIFDIFCVSTGFVVRLYAGGYVFGVSISEWLFLSVFLLATFLSVGKRYSEKLQLGDAAGEHRRTLDDYPPGFLDGALYLSGSATLVTYSIYAISTPLLVFSVPLCMFGLFRYLFLLQSGRSGDPSEALVRDLPMLIISFLWLLVVGWSVYR